MVAESLNDINMSEEAAEVLRCRRESSKTSDSKLEALKLMVSPDGRVRDLFGYLGAPRTGRWNSHGPQFANQPRPVKKVEKNFDRAVELILKEDFETIVGEFDSVMDVIAGCIRACYKAPEGMEFVIADYAAIEPRILGWLTNCTKINDIFRNGEDPYISFASILYGVPYDEVTKEMRQNAKPGFLGCGYMLSGGEEYLNKDGDLVRSGVWGYAQSMGIDIPKDLAHKAVKVFRNEYKEVCDFWYNSDDAIKQVIKTKKKLKFDKLIFDISGQTLRMLLPSGRYLHYIRPKIQQEEFKGKIRDQITFEGIDGKTKAWVRQSTHPGRVTENAVSGIARDALLEGMKLADKNSIPVCGHVHDEVVALAAKNESEKVLDKLLGCMRKSVPWAKDLILDANGFCSTRYRKG
jgi:DNA polymerase